MTFDGSSDDLKSRWGDLKSSMRPRDLFRGHWEQGGPRRSRGRPGDPIGPSGWFDESSDNSGGI